MDKKTPNRKPTESAAKEAPQEADLWRELTELGKQIASAKVNWENQAEVDNLQRLMDRQKAVAHLLCPSTPANLPPSPADQIGEFFHEANATLRFVDVHYDTPIISCPRSDPEYPAELARLEEHRREVDDHERKAAIFLKGLHADADKLADVLATIGEDTKPVLEFMQMIPCHPGAAFGFESAPAWAKLRELWPLLDSIRRRLVAEARGHAGRPAGSGDTKPKADRKTAQEWSQWLRDQRDKGNHTASFEQYAKKKGQNARAVMIAVDRDRKRPKSAREAKRTSK